MNTLENLYENMSTTKTSGNKIQPFAAELLTDTDLQGYIAAMLINNEKQLIDIRLSKSIKDRHSVDITEMVFDGICIENNGFDEYEDVKGAINFKHINDTSYQFYIQ